MNPSQAVPKTLFDFQQRFPTDAECEEFLIAWRWPEGFRCPRCGHDDAVKLRFRREFQCRRCEHQTSVTAGTAMHKSKVGLRKWFWAMFLVARHKKSISALQLQRDLGIGSYRTAWLLLHKIRASFDESPDFPLKGFVEVDETLVGAKNKGDPASKAPGRKAIVVGAVALGSEAKSGRGHRWNGVRLQRVPDYSKESLGGFVRKNIECGAHLLTDGWSGYRDLPRTGYQRTIDVSSTYTRAQLRKLNPMRHVHLLFSNFKTWLTGRFHGVSHKYIGRYADEFVYRVNRRNDPPKIFGWIARRLMNRPHVSLAELKRSESSA